MAQAVEMLVELAKVWGEAADRPVPAVVAAEAS